MFTIQRDLTAHSGYGVATGSPNALLVNIKQAQNTYEDGMFVAFKPAYNNTGPATINVNGLGERAIKKANGSNLGVNTLKVDSIYSLRYNADTSSFILQGEGGSGNAETFEVLKGRTFTNDAGEQTGTVTFHGSNGDPVQNIQPGKVDINIPKGYYAGNAYSGIVKGDINLIPGNIRKGANIFGVSGSAPSLTTVTPGNQLLASSTNVKQITGTAEYATRIKEYRVYVSGTVRVKFTMETLSVIMGGGCVAKIYINNVAVGPESSASNGSDKNPQTYTQDYSVNSGDLICLWGYAKKTEWAGKVTAFSIGVAEGSPFVYPEID